MNHLTSFDTCWRNFMESLTARLLKVQQEGEAFTLEKANMALIGVATRWFSDFDLCGGWRNVLMEEVPEIGAEISDILENEMRFSREIAQEKGNEDVIQYGAALASGLAGFGLSSVLKTNRTIRLLMTVAPGATTYLTLQNVKSEKRRKRAHAFVQAYLCQLTPHYEKIRTLLSQSAQIE